MKDYSNINVFASYNICYWNVSGIVFNSHFSSNSINFYDAFTIGIKSKIKILNLINKGSKKRIEIYPNIFIGNRHKILNKQIRDLEIEKNFFTFGTGIGIDLALFKRFSIFGEYEYLYVNNYVIPSIAKPYTFDFKFGIKLFIF